MPDIIGSNEAAAVAFGYMHHLLPLLVAKGVITPDEMSTLTNKVREGLPEGNCFRKVDQFIDALMQKATER